MRDRWLASGLSFVCVLASCGAVTSALALGWSFNDALNAFVVSNIAIGLSFGLCGALIAWHRPRLPLGWLYAAGGAFQTLTAFAAPLAQLLHDQAMPLWLVRADMTVFG